MYDVVLLTLGSERDAPGGGCGSGGACCGGADDTAAESGEERCETPRVPVLACADELTARGARVTTVTARSDSEIDEVLARLDGPPRADGLTWPDSDGKTRLIVATASDGQLRAVLRRLVRRYAPPPSRRPTDLAANRTVPDLPPVGVLPLDPARSGTARDLAAQLGLPRDPAGVAAAVLDGTARRLDLLRNDGGSVTLDGALLGAADDAGRPLHWRARVEVDGTVLSDGSEPITACAIGNAGGYARLGEVDLLGGPDPADGRVTVGVAVPVVTRSALGRKKVRLEVRRARGRAVAVVPRDEKVPFLDDGVEGELSRKRSWWTEPGAWAVWTG
ncbi:diacylglycerol kinase family protein [Micromonospora aurantiaca]|uniref:diacylglycerol kinase family protein n=1 Tax=Micromonospora aurantiaca (nom. illeg.) TaxID=47850 RepID=UPI000827E5FE|nr:diacylglycerol kinase family protein [Micromonospora aurantiaca]SCL39072.1 Diacylglycerol kinase catalytic domain-containing protein [Micromonospora aurantiaca]